MESVWLGRDKASAREFTLLALTTSRVPLSALTASLVRALCTSVSLCKFQEKKGVFFSVLFA